MGKLGVNSDILHINSFRLIPHPKDKTFYYYYNNDNSTIIANYIPLFIMVAICNVVCNNLDKEMHFVMDWYVYVVPNAFVFSSAIY